MLERMWTKGRHFFISGGKANLYNHSGNQYGIFLRKLGINLPQELTILFLSIYPKDAQLYYKDICSTIFIATLFIIART